jgi:hypothetical protein
MSYGTQDADAPIKTSSSFELASFRSNHTPNEETQLIEVNNLLDSNVENLTRKLTVRTLIIFISLICSSVLVLFIVIQTIMNMIAQSTPKSIGKKLQLKTLSQHDEIVFTKVNMPNHDIVYGENYSRYQSNTFEFYPEEFAGEIHTTDDEHIGDGTCFRIKSLNGKWLSVDYDNKVKAIASAYYYAYSFSIHYVGDDLRQAKFKMCKKNRWLYMSFDSIRNEYFLQVSPKASQKDETEVKLKYENQATIFELSPVDFYKGVNFGGWFIPEVWMLWSFFNGTGLGWGGSLCAVCVLILAII